jgi:hypothetical protein
MRKADRLRPAPWPASASVWPLVASIDGLKKNLFAWRAKAHGMAKFTLRSFFPELRAFFRKMLRGFFRELPDFFRKMKPGLEIVLGAVLATFLATAALHLQWIAAHVTGDIRDNSNSCSVLWTLFAASFLSVSIRLLGNSNWIVRHNRHHE